jgi:hypothetical protein
MNAPIPSVLIHDLGFGLLAIIVAAAASVVAQVHVFESCPLVCWPRQTI